MSAAISARNKDARDPIADYVSLFSELYEVSDYVTINISSPNTPGLRALQGKEMLTQLLQEIKRLRVSLSQLYHKNTPVLIKIAPDMIDREMEDVAEVALAYQIDGLIVSNTTIGEREKLGSQFKHEMGGLSGWPLGNLRRVCSNI